MIGKCDIIHIASSVFMHMKVECMGAILEMKINGVLLTDNSHELLLSFSKPCWFFVFFNFCYELHNLTNIGCC